MVDKLQGTWGAQWITPQIQYMLSYIWHQHCRIVAFSRCLVIKCRMTPFKVVGMDILLYSNSGFPDVVVLCQIGLFILEAAEPTLNHDVVCPATFSIHALADAVFLYKVNVLLTCKLTALIRVQYLRFCHFESFFQGVDNHSGIKRVIYFPADNTTAIPVDHGCQIQKSALDRNICNVNRPGLIWFVYDCITKKIRTYFRLLHPLGKIHLWVDGVNIHFIHVASCLATSNIITMGFQLCRHLSCSPGGIVSMKMVNDLFTGQFFF